MPSFPLSDFSFAQLLTSSGLSRLDKRFLAYLQEKDASLSEKLVHYRQGQPQSPQELSDFIMALALVLQDFLAELFDIEQALVLQRQAAEREQVIFRFKKHFVLREAKRRLKKSQELPSFAALDQCLSQQLPPHDDSELALAQYAMHLLSDKLRYADAIETVIHWCVQALATPEGQAVVRDWASFHLPQRLDYQHLLPIEPVPTDHLARQQMPETKWQARAGFALTDPRMSSRQVSDELHYCVYCHQNDGDFCSKGFPVKKGDQAKGLKINPLGEELTGCPLEEKISEMQLLKKDGHSLAALATIMIDNPLCPATGHRICNDCMKACVYQKQEPVNIPQIETRVLTDVLALPWGVELYDLLVRWNPLRQTQWLAKPYNGKKILVMGMGPAGFTLAHHLLMEGFAVVGADGLKIEPLPPQYLTEPIFDYQSITESLDERVIAGFGGVAEYGITARWDKNFLKLIYISLMRRPYFQVFGSLRFGGSLQVSDAWKLGFDHLAVAVGAGLPRELNIPNSLAPGMRQANDFLMALQLTGAAKANSLANLQLRLPAVVIGGGLTAIDTATEVQAYYLAQIEKVAQRYEILKKAYGAALLRSRFDASALEIIDEFLAHFAAVESERQQALAENREPNWIHLLRQWGGVTVIYRRRLQDSPAYQRNHEEVASALEQGIYYADCLSPEAVLLDAQGQVSGLTCRERHFVDGVWSDSAVLKKFPAKAILVATGAKPNVAYEFEHRGTFLRDELSYQRFDEKGQRLVNTVNCKASDFGPFTSYQKDDYRVSFLGDTHPVFHGSVVKAIASAKQIYPFITRQVLQQAADSCNDSYQDFKKGIAHLLQATVVSVQRHSDELVELIVRAPLAASHFHPGQFYRLQNYETSAQQVAGTLLQTEAMALLAAPVAEDAELLSFWVLERGVSSRLVARFKPGELLALMGPTGAKMKIDQPPERIIILGGMMALAQLRSLGPALRARGHEVIFAACADIEALSTHRVVIEQYSDKILWLGSDWVNRLLEHEAIATSIDRVIVVGSGRLVKQMQQARSGALSAYFRADTRFFASVYGAMQCMLKGVCAQCLQWQIDPKTGKRTKAVYACSWQDQPLEQIDSDNIEQRLSQNYVLEQLSNQWLDYLQEFHIGV